MSSKDKYNIYLEEILKKIYLSDLINFKPYSPKFNNLKLFDHQVCALNNAIKYLLTPKYDLKEAYSRQDKNLEKFIKDGLLRRISFWMATGSGKTFIIVKLLEILYILVKQKLIDKRNILILAPKDDIITQIKDAIGKFNNTSNLEIELHSLKEYDSIKNEYSLFDNSILRVFYYRADNIKDSSTDAYIDYKSILNGGKWYLVLDEAHKGDKESSKRQEYFKELTTNGELFNFSATFTDEIDIHTTGYDLKLDRFIQNGYGKNIHVYNENFKNFNKTKKLDDDNKKDVILHSLVLLALAKKIYFNKKDNLKNRYYHNPLMMVIANSVAIKDADLKLYFETLVSVVKKNVDIKQIKRDVVSNLKENRNYLFVFDKIDDELIEQIKYITYEDILKYVFNTSTSNDIEWCTTGSKNEIAFKVKGGGEYFALLNIGEIKKWTTKNIAHLVAGKSIEKSFFKSLNKNSSTINILMGKQIFAEGWDTNRINIVNLINIGMDAKNKKFIYQAIGRGIRINPYVNFKKRFNRIYIKDENSSSKSLNNLSYYKKQALESLFVFATNVDAVKNIFKTLNEYSKKLKKVEGIVKTNTIKDCKLYIPIIKKSKNKITNKYPISIEDKNTLEEYMKTTPDEVTVAQYNLSIYALNKIKEIIDFVGDKRDNKPKKIEFILSSIDNFVNQEVKVFAGFKSLNTDDADDITHYKNILTNLDDSSLKKLNNCIKTILQDEILTKDELLDLVLDEKITKDEYREKLEIAPKNKIENNNINIDKFGISLKKIKEHYYKPMILQNRDDNYFSNIIKTDSEVEFIDDLIKYLDKNKLDRYEWWYFSRIQHSKDKICIPYYDNRQETVRDFYPDFIFWFKDNEKYYLRFIDPKGLEHPLNPKDKAEGFKAIFNNNTKQFNDKDVDIKLFYYNKKPSKYFKGDYLENHIIDSIEKIF